MKTHAFIFARGGSKGVPRKNIRLFAGEPLIVHTIRQALRLPAVSRVFVSTEDPEIAAVAREAGAEVPFLRPAPLAADDSPEWKSWQHAVEFVRNDLKDPFDRFVSLPVTSPLRSDADVAAILDRHRDTGADLVMGVTPAAGNPFFNMVRLVADGVAELAVIPEGGKVFRRQDAPEVFDMAPGAYVTTPDHIMAVNGVMQGVVKTVTIPRERAVDIDTMLDFDFAEFLFLRAKNDPR